MTTSQILPSSFRDPSGFVFERDGVLYRQVNDCYHSEYDHLMQSGLYEKLAQSGRLVRHTEVAVAAARTDGAYKVLRPERAPFVSYSYEWCFSQLRDAANVTLEAMRQALEYGMVLKDASACNIQFLRGEPILIDTLSFALHRDGDPWVAYRQFCQHFLAPLALMSSLDLRLGQILACFLDGVPLDLASTLLPKSTYLKPQWLVHVHLHAKSQRHFAGRSTKTATRRRMGRRALLGLVSELQRCIHDMRGRDHKSAWSDYYDETNYSSGSLEQKRRTVQAFLDRIRPATVWDLGANTGAFSRLASERGIFTLAFDQDAVCVDRTYRDSRRRGETHLLPLVLDLANPSPGTGWGNQERLSLMERGPADAALALALVHHLAIGNNVPLPRLAATLAKLCRHLVIEFVPKSDSQVQRLLASRTDIFPDYTRADFEHAFAERFSLFETVQLQDSERTLYRMQVRADCTT